MPQDDILHQTTSESTQPVSVKVTSPDGHSIIVSEHFEIHSDQCGTAR
jgi:hypothetical protein